MSGETNSLFSKGNLAIHILHVNSGRTVSFKAFLTQFQETFASSYEEQYFVMHPEPIRKWKSTVRSINLGWKIVARDTAEAENNLRKISSLTSFLYGEQVQRSAGGMSFFSPKVGGSPIFRVKLMNLMTDSILGGGGESGILGYIEGFTYTMNLDQPFFNKESDGLLEKLLRKDTNLQGKAPGLIYPQLVDASFTFYPVHEKTPAWINQNFSIPRFPYGVAPVAQLPKGKTTLTDGQKDLLREDAGDKDPAVLPPEPGLTEGQTNLSAEHQAAAKEAAILESLRRQNPTLK